MEEIKLTESKYDNKECFVEMFGYDKKVKGIVLGHFESVTDTGELLETFVIKLMDKVKRLDGRVLKMCYRSLDEIEFI